MPLKPVTHLLHAVHYNDREALERMLTRGDDPNARHRLKTADKTEMAPLTLAVQRNNQDLVDALMQAGAHWRGDPPHELPALATALIENHLDLAKHLVAEYGADPHQIYTMNGQGGVPNNLLMSVVKGGNAASIEWLLQQGVAVDGTYPNWTPLMQALTARSNLVARDPQGQPLEPERLERYEALLALIDAGANLDLRDASDMPLLQIAIENTDVEVVQRLLQKGANPNDIYRQPVSETLSYIQPVLAAAIARSPYMAQALIQAGASTEGRLSFNPSSSTGNVHADSESDEELKAESTSRRHTDATWLMWAALKGAHGTVTALLPLMSEEDIRAQDSQGCTALHHAARIANADTVRGVETDVHALLKAGVPVDAQDRQGRTALGRFIHEAVRHGFNHFDSFEPGADHAAFERMMGSLLEAGADPDIQDIHGVSALFALENWLEPQPYEPPQTETVERQLGRRILARLKAFQQCNELQNVIEEPNARPRSRF